MNKCDQSNWSSSDKFGAITGCSVRHFLEDSLCISIKAANKVSFKKKKYEHLLF